MKTIKTTASIRVETILKGNIEVAVLASNNPEYEKALGAALVAQYGGTYWQEGQTTYYYNGAGLYQDMVNQIRSR